MQERTLLKATGVSLLMSSMATWCHHCNSDFSVCLELNLYTNSSSFIRKHTLICSSYFLPPRVQVMITLFTKQCACVSKTLLSLKLSASGKTEASFCQ